MTFPSVPRAHFLALFGPSSGFTKLGAKGPSPYTSTTFPALCRPKWAIVAGIKECAPGFRSISLDASYFSPRAIRNEPVNTVMCSSVGCQWGGTLTSPLLRMRITYTPPFLSGSPDTMAISTPGMSGFHTSWPGVITSWFCAKAKTDISKMAPTNTEPAMLMACSRAAALHNRTALTTLLMGSISHLGGKPNRSMRNASCHPHGHLVETAWRSLATSHRDRERERRALAQLALDPDPPAVEFDELPHRVNPSPVPSAFFSAVPT